VADVTKVGRGVRGYHGRRVEVKDVRHSNVILLLNSITEMRGGVVGEGLQECPADARVVFLFRLGEGVQTGREG
jgi:hypothetical protein